MKKEIHISIYVAGRRHTKRFLIYCETEKPPQHLDMIAHRIRKILLEEFVSDGITNIQLCSHRG